MQRCLELAMQGELSVAPNPMVGCVIVHKDTIVAEGYHQKYGEAHAEVLAFASLPTDINLHNCEVYVNLEPCSHFGKTPPCADLIIAQKPKRVIIGTLDPNVRVAGAGIKKLIEANINVTVGILENECQQLNRKFMKAQLTKLPYITLKWAETHNGYMARVHNDGSSSKISDPKNDAWVHHLRATHQAILVGAETVNRDNPALDVRYGNGTSPIKIVYSPRLTVDLDKQLFAQGKTIVYNNLKSETALHYELVCLDDFSLQNVLQDLYSKNIHSILVEGGARILALFLEHNMWDETIILKSNADWTDGIKAPWMGIKSYKDHASFEDTIKYFKHS